MVQLLLRTLLSIFTLSPHFLLAETSSDIVAENSQSSQFILGRETGPNLSFRAADNPNLRFQLGVRIMGTARFQDERTSADTDSWDFFLRRARLEAGVEFHPQVKFKMDLRNDRADEGDGGNGEFELGDAKLTWTGIAGNSLLNLATYRAKVDVSRSQTISSANLVYYERAAVADAAANWVNHNRRATNVQLYGTWENKLHYSLALGDGVSSDSFEDALGQEVNRIGDLATPMFGGKVRLSPFEGWEEIERSETYFGKGKHFSVGVGLFEAREIEAVMFDDRKLTLDRRLVNLEFSGHYHGGFVQFEYFELDGAIADFRESSPEVGRSNGWSLLMEYCTRPLYVAPFIRLDSWNRFEERAGFNQRTFNLGINWYLRGNSTKLGLVYERRSFGAGLYSDDQNRISVTSQIHF